MDTIRLAPDAATLRVGYERGLRYRKRLQDSGRPCRCDQCRTCLKEAVRLLALSKIDPGFRIADALAQEYGMDREQMREDCYYSAAVDTIAVYCGGEAREIILRGQKYLDRKTVMQISRTAPARQRYEITQVRQGLRPLITNGKGCPVYDTVDFKEVLSRMRRAQGKLAICLLGIERLSLAQANREGTPGLRVRLEEIRADTEKVILGVEAAPDGVPCRCDVAKKPKSSKKTDKELVVPADSKGVLGLLNQARSWTDKNARDLAELLQTVSPIRPEKEEVRRRGRTISQTAKAILRGLDG